MFHWGRQTTAANQAVGGHPLARPQNTPGVSVGPVLLQDTGLVGSQWPPEELRVSLLEARALATDTAQQWQESAQQLQALRQQLQHPSLPADLRAAAAEVSRTVAELRQTVDDVRAAAQTQVLQAELSQLRRRVRDLEQQLAAAAQREAQLLAALQARPQAGSRLDVQEVPDRGEDELWASSWGLDMPEPVAKPAVSRSQEAFPKRRLL